MSWTLSGSSLFSKIFVQHQFTFPLNITWLFLLCYICQFISETFSLEQTLHWMHRRKRWCLSLRAFSSVSSSSKNKESTREDVFNAAPSPSSWLIFLSRILRRRSRWRRAQYGWLLQFACFLHLLVFHLFPASHPQVVPQMSLPDLGIRPLWLLGKACQELLEQLLVHVVAHLVQNEPAVVLWIVWGWSKTKVSTNQSPCELLLKKDFRASMSWLSSK